MAGRPGDGGSEELYYLDAEGVKQDAAVHDQILSARGARVGRDLSRADLAADGWSQEDIDAVLPTSTKKRPARRPRRGQS